ncbi:MAG: hypothetical protein Harvfovirus57_8 [Harvfovirus sp.]|uniref:Uncharacterized protein n=1 Tax=Harvfovirus sp. TaxID=2487768 RepID=A0A3G5A8P7_9VIRU|nr:MAG: hypothetical protein Harvfovirus57_8 [Harvfovirus sp.]
MLIQKEIKQTSMERIGTKSNYNYGIRKEATVGRLVKTHLGAESFKRSSGSRGPSDVRVKTKTRSYDIQVKSSRASTASDNRVSREDKMKLISYSRANNSIPLLANFKGSNVSVTYAKSGRTLLKK